MRFPPRDGSIDDTIYLHTELSERLLERLCQINSAINPMSDLAMSLFDSDATRLRSAKLTNATKLTVEGLKTLQGHKITELEIRGLTKSTVTDVIDECLGKLYKCYISCSGRGFRNNSSTLKYIILRQFRIISQDNGVLKI